MSNPIDISNQRQLFVDNLLIDSLENVRIHQHAPIPRETVLTLNQPWEGETSWCPVVIKDGDKYRMWYRSQDTQQNTGGFNHTFTAYAESEDGIHWTRPNLGLFEFNGSTNNNICVDNPNTKNIAVFKDERPGIPESERYKAAGRWSDGKPACIYGLVSPDGIHWKNASDDPFIVAPENDPNFDSPISAFWDAHQECYVLYARGRFPFGQAPPHTRHSNDHLARLHSLGALAIHYDQRRKTLRTRTLHKCRPPLRTRTLLPGLSQALHPNPQILHRLGTRRPLRRALPRQQRLVLLCAKLPHTQSPHSTLHPARRRFCLSTNQRPNRNLTTKPFTFSGNQLQINYSTSVAGSIRIALLDESGTGLPGYTLDDCSEIFGDEIAHTVHWNQINSVNVGNTQPIRLQIELKEADLYSFSWI